MIGSERRRNPRTKLERFAYINLGANNYGSVLNVSECGLCFLSNIPVEKGKSINFWFSEHNHRIEATGELVWVDSTHKTGGLRFTSMPTEAREQVLDWMRSAPIAVPAAGSTVSYAANGALPAAAIPNGVPVPAPYPQVAVPSHLRGFSGGLVTGVLISMVITGALLFQIYQRQFGESLIRLGQKFATQPQTTQTTTTAAKEPPALSGPPVPQEVSSNTPAHPQPDAQAVQSSQKKVTPTGQPAPPPDKTATPEPTPSASVSPQKQAPATVDNSLRPEQGKLEAARLVVPASSTSEVPHTTAAVPAVVPAPPSEKVSPPTPVVSAANTAPPKPSAAQPDPPASHAVAGAQVTREVSPTKSSGPPPEVFLEVGKFKERSLADQQTGELAQLGFPASVLEKGHLWSNSYVVLVGPFGNDASASDANRNLVAHDFKPRPFERGSRNIVLGPKLVVNGAPVPNGDCTIKWESYLSGTNVKFMQDHFVVGTASGVWVKNDAPFEHDAFVYRKNGDGSRTLLEIQFAGFDKTLVFGKSS